MVTARAEAGQSSPPIETRSVKERINPIALRIFQLMDVSRDALHDGMIGMLPIGSRTIDELREMFCQDIDLDLGTSQLVFPGSNYCLVSCGIQTTVDEDIQSLELSFNPSWRAPSEKITSRIKIIGIKQWLKINKSLITVVTDDGGVFIAEVKINERGGRNGQAKVTFFVTEDPFGDGLTYPPAAVSGKFDRDGKFLGENLI